VIQDNSHRDGPRPWRQSIIHVFFYIGSQEKAVSDITHRCDRRHSEEAIPHRNRAWELSLTWHINPQSRQILQIIQSISEHKESHHLCRGSSTEGEHKMEHYRDLLLSLPS